MRKLLSLLTLFVALASLSLASPAFAKSLKTGNGATGVGQQTDDDVGPPGKQDGAAKDVAPGQQDKRTGKPDNGDDDDDDGDDDQDG